MDRGPRADSSALHKIGTAMPLFGAQARPPRREPESKIRLDTEMTQAQANYVAGFPYPFPARRVAACQSKRVSEGGGRRPEPGAARLDHERHRAERLQVRASSTMAATPNATIIPR